MLFLFRRNALITTALLFSANVIVPILGLLALGWVLNKTGQLESNLVAGLNLLVYRYTLPALLFFSVMKSNVAIGAQWRLILAGYMAILLLYFFATFMAKRHFRPYDRGVFVQGVYRSNMAIVGLALVRGVYGEGAVAVAAVFAGASSLLLNAVAVVALTEHTGNSSGFNRALLLKVLQNPLIIALLIALPLKGLGVKLPEMVLHFGDYLASRTLPLALLCAGATFDLRGVDGGRVVYWACAGRLLLAPLVYVLVGLLLGFDGENLGILFLMAATPAATAGYIMAKAMPGNNAVAAANIIALSNVGSLLVVGLGISFFPALGWV